MPRFLPADRRSYAALFAFVSVVVASFSPMPAATQESDRGTETPPRGGVPAPVYVAIPDAFPSIDARAMVVREPGVDLIVLRDGEADIDALSMALHVLRDARRRLPTPTAGSLIPIMGFSVTVEVSARVRARLEQTLRRLAHAESVDLGSLGRGRRVRWDLR